MWLWIVAGWCATSVLLAVLHHRLLRLQPALMPEVEAFLLAFETQLARHPQVQYRGLLPGQFACLLRVRGQDTPLSLYDLHRRVEAFPDRFAATVDQLVSEIEEIGLDRIADHEFGHVATAILPQVRNRKWVDAQGRFGDSALVQRPLNAELSVVYVIDDPHTMVFVCRAHLTAWRRQEEDLHRLALGNLQRRAGGAALPLSHEPLLLQTGDGYDAARVLLLDETARSDSLLVAVPDRDTLWVAQEEGQNLASLMAATEAMAQQAPHPVSDRLFRFRAGRLEPVAGRTAPSVPADPAR